MTRIVLITCVMSLVAACTGPNNSGPAVRDSTPRHVPEPTTTGVHVSGHVIVGVSTGN